MKSGFMRGMLSAAVFLLAASNCNLHAQTAPEGPVDAKVCEIMKAPGGFDGKTVRIQATVIAGLEEFIIQDPAEKTCGLKINGIWLSYPKGANALAGPEMMVQIQAAHNFAGTVPAPRPAVKLEKNKDWREFDTLLSQPYKGHGLCLGCERNTVTATLTGRIDVVRSAKLTRNAEGKVISIGGFGNLNAYPVQLVLESVENPVAQPVDYSKIADVVKGDSEQLGDPGNPIGAIGAVGGAANAKTPTGQLIKRTVDVFGAFDKSGNPVTYNGIEFVTGVTVENETGKYDGQSRHDSPDGLIYYCNLNTDKLHNIMMNYAIILLGSHIADIRGQQPPTGPMDLIVMETNGWLTNAYYARGIGQDNVILPGGYVLWSAKWQAADRSKQLNEGLVGFLGNEDLLHP